MELQERTLEVLKSARYAVSPCDPEKVKEVWFVCHGYGQLAPAFLEDFEPIFQEDRMIIAPEGLHRFYLKGTGGKVGASWMTKEEREKDIQDYVRYLDQLYDHTLHDLIGREIRIRILGFSQGVATVCRWMAHARSRADELILWAGVFPPDLDLSIDKRVFQRMRIRLLVGDQDEYRSQEKLTEEARKFQEHDIPYEFREFEGSHRIEELPLKALAEGRLGDP
ncbi:MAG: alpha/beta hydrolase [Flavobacteriales bacterium]